jgi:hypothetical protein
MKIDLEKAWTVKEFADAYGYNEEYVRQCCRGQADFRTEVPLSLPPGWTKTKIGRNWFLFPPNKTTTKNKRKKRTTERR